ncbi:hypothetical protein HK107_13645 [Parvularcula sp. ZS-1/3]|uniref:Rad50/SbcC-type AAA domain-containing protein n=1 Tax=Parvularcula mediterranea TaxID=2732508 RepID=A0A7Y3RPF0_9PROT|nr:ATP-binding protein [Parvularcula mediterranea]NNU17370.1 hypothetical protein [Parvularcula mediterranea]
MKIEALRVRNLRKFGAKGLAIENFAPGINLLARPNEFGKSALFDALRAGLFFKPTANNRETRALKPEAGGDPLVEIDLSSQQGSFRVRKHFMGSRKGSGTQLLERPTLRELAREDAAIAKIAEMLGAASPTEGTPGLLWLAQGEGFAPGLSGEQRKTADGLLSSEVTEAAMGGDVGRVRSRTEAELQKLETLKTGKATGEMATALKTVSTLESDVAELEQKVRLSSDLRSEVEGLSKREARLSEPKETERRREELREARLAAKEAELDLQKASHTREQLAAAEAALQTARDKQTELQASLKELESKEKARGMAAAALTAVQDDLGHTEAALKAASEKREGEQARHDTLSREFAEARRNEALEREQAEAERLRETKERVDTVMKDAQRLREVLKAPAIDLAQLAKLETAVLRAKAAEEAEAPVLTLEEGGPATLNGEDLRAGEGQTLSGSAAIEIGGTRLTVDVPDRGNLARSRATAEGELAAFLSAAGAKNAEDAAEIERSRKAAEADLKRLDAERKRLAPDGLGAIEARLETLAAAEQPAGDLRRLEDIEPLLDEAKTALDAASADERRAQAFHKAASDKALEAKFAAATNEKDCERLLSQLGDEAARAGKLAAAEDAVLAGERARGARASELEALEKNVAAGQAATTRLKRLEEVERKLGQELSSLRENLAQKRGQLRALDADGAEEQLAAAVELLEAASQRAEQLEERRKALRMLLTLIDDEEAQRRDRVVEPVMATIRPMAARLLGAEALRFDSEWRPEAVDRQGLALGDAQLSGGTREQLALLTRIGFAKLAASQGEPMPLILDDPLSYADDDRIKVSFDLLHELAQETQIIIFSCHEQVFDELGAHRLETEAFPEN